MARMAAGPGLERMSEVAVTAGMSSATVGHTLSREGRCFEPDLWHLDACTARIGSPN